MKKTYLLSLIVISSLFCQAQPGTLDSDFDADGKVTSLVSAGSNSIGDLVVQPDGKIVAVIYAHNGTDYDFGAIRYNIDGSIDNTFGTGGSFIQDLNNAYDYSNSIALQNDGKIVLAGTTGNGLNDDFCLMRLNPNGTLDNTFSVDGIVKTSFGAENDDCYCMAIQPDGKIVVAGYTDLGSTNSLAMARYNTDGTLDLTFNGTGKVTESIGTDGTVIWSMGLQSDGKIVLVGGADNGFSYRFTAIRYTTTGQLDVSFSNDGYEVFQIGSELGIANAMAVCHDNKIILAGYYTNSGDNDLAILKLNANGSVDNSFGTSGLVTSDIDGQSNTINDIYVQPDGKLVFAGVQGLNANAGFLVGRFDSTGLWDTGFGTYGYVTTNFDVSRDEAKAVVMQPDGRIVAGGLTWIGTEQYAAMARYLSGLNIGTPEFGSLTATVLIYPNPVHGEAILEYDLQQVETISLKLMDITGNEIRVFSEAETQKAGKQQKLLNLNGVPAGNYVIVLSNGQGTQSIRIMII